MPKDNIFDRMILITGATGFVGSYLAKLLLERGEKIRAIKRASSLLNLLGNYAEKIDWVEGDILDVVSLEEAMKGVSRVYHCAAMISFAAKDTEALMKVNIEGTANVMNAAIYAGVEKVVHVSSVAAFGLPIQGKIIDEKYSDPNINKAFWYFRSKQYGEREAWRAAEEGLSVVVACPGTILGAGWWDAEPNSIFGAVANGLSFYTTATNGFVDVRDVAEALVLLMEKGANGEKYILVSENLSYKELIWQVADEMKVRRPSIAAKKWLLTLAWISESVKTIFTKKEPLVTRESAAIAGVSFMYSNEKIKQLCFSFRPIRTTISDTTKAYLDSKAEQKNFGSF